MESLKPYPQELRKQLTSTVRYKLCKVVKASHYDLDTGTVQHRLSVPSQEYIFNNYAYFDKATETSYTMRYIIGEKVQETANGAIVMPVYGNIIFKKSDNGIMTLNPLNSQHQILYTIMEFHPSNTANGGSLFTKVDAQAAANDEYKRDLESFNALEKVMKMKSSDLDYTCKGLLLQFDMPLEKVADNVKKITLKKIAEANPVKFLEDIKGLNFETKAVVRDAEILKNIIYDESKQSWIYTRSNEVLHAKMPALDRYESIVEWMKSSKSGEVAYEKLKLDNAKVDTKVVEK
jgi:hypothetical protein